MAVAMTNDEDFISTNYDAIPSELKSLKQWFCYKLNLENGKTVKKNFNPKTGLEINFYRETFTFEECSYKVSMGNYDGLGFWLNDTQIYSVISLNAGGTDLTFIKKFEEIVNTICSYTEMSQSGFDFKIWIKGRVDANIIGAKKEIEILTKNCFVYMTGNRLKYTKIIESQGYLSQIYKQASNDSNILKFADLKAKEEKSDEQIIKDIRNSKDDNSYIALKNNLWKGEFYNSEQEAEIAFIEIIAKHTKNIEQIGRIFGESKIYNDAKGWQYYEEKINRCLAKVKTTQIDDIQKVIESIQIPKQKKLINPNDILIPKDKVEKLDKSIFETEKRLLEKEYEEEKQEVINHENNYQELQYPPGFAGVLAKYFFDQSSRQVKEISIIGALCMLCSIVGRSHNVSRVGLNQYIMLLAKSGIGKGEVANGFDRMFSEVSKTLPQIKNFMGAGGIASGQALSRDVAKNPCQICILGEFYNTIEKMSSDKAQAHDKDLMKILCDYYTKSGKHSEVQRIIYANSKSNVEPTKAPALSIFGECNPGDMYRTINERLISNGLLPRFIMIHYRGERQYMNKSFRNYQIPKDLVKKIHDMAENSLKLNAMNEVIEVRISEEVEIYFDEIDKKTTDYIRESHSSATIDLWNRVQLKVIKLSALLAVGDNFLDPEINIEQAKWAYDLILRDTQDLINKFDAGEIGHTNESSQQINDVISAIKFYLNSENNVLAKYKVNFDMQSIGIIGYSFIYNKVSHYASFKNSRFPVPKLCKEALKNLEDRGYIEPCFSNEVKNLGGRKGLYYKIINKNVFGVK